MATVRLLKELREEPLNVGSVFRIRGFLGRKE